MGVRKPSRTNRQYEAGDRMLPRWWTDGPYSRDTRHKYSYQELEEFYSGHFVRVVLGHTGGMTQMPEEKEDEVCSLVPDR